MLIHIMYMKQSNNINELWSLIENGKSGRNIGIKTGLDKLDNVIGGIQSSRYMVIGAQSSAGKTSLYLFIMYNILKNITENKPVYFLIYSLEISADVLLAKLMALYCAEEFGIYLTINNIFSFESPLSDRAFQCLQQAKVWIEDKMKYIEIFDQGLNAKALYNKTLNFAKKHGTFETADDDLKYYIPNNKNQLILGVIDHLNLSQPQPGNTLKQEIDLISSYMVTLKKKLRMSWIALMQQNRDSTSMDRRKADLFEPGLNDLKDSSNPGQDADIVLQMFYPFREKLNTYRGFPIMSDTGYKRLLRSVITSKNNQFYYCKIINFVVSLCRKTKFKINIYGQKRQIKSCYLLYF